MEAGAIPPLVDLLAHGSDNAKQQAAGALKILSVNDDNEVLSSSLSVMTGNQTAVKGSGLRC